jgi:hypothetical protein
MATFQQQNTTHSIYKPTASSILHRFEIKVRPAQPLQLHNRPNAVRHRMRHTELHEHACLSQRKATPTFITVKQNKPQRLQPDQIHERMQPTLKEAHIPDTSLQLYPTPLLLDYVKSAVTEAHSSNVAGSQAAANSDCCCRACAPGKATSPAPGKAIASRPKTAGRWDCSSGNWHALPSKQNICRPAHAWLRLAAAEQAEQGSMTVCIWHLPNSQYGNPVTENFTV